MAGLVALQVVKYRGSTVLIRTEKTFIWDCKEGRKEKAKRSLFRACLSSYVNIKSVPKKKMRRDRKRNTLLPRNSNNSIFQ
jgi:hypothetical protein